MCSAYIPRLKSWVALLLSPCGETPHPSLRDTFSRWEKAGVRLFSVDCVPTTKVVGCILTD
ncbi:hypothetical protein J7M00_02730 [bacterium]|nr:hypothetical protein [bacterium]